MADKAGDRQVGGDHYKNTGGECIHCGGRLEHWDISAIFGWDGFVHTITKYLWRWREKNGVEDLEKALHNLERYIELARAEQPLLEPGQVDALLAMHNPPKFKLPDPAEFSTEPEAAPRQPGSNPPLPRGAKPEASPNPPLPFHVLEAAIRAGLEAMRETRDDEGGPGAGYVDQDRGGESSSDLRNGLGTDSLPALEQPTSPGCK